MRVKALGAYGGQMPGKNNTAFLVNGELLVDAGTIGLALSIKEQRAIRAALISHAHADHIGALPFLAVNITSNKAPGVVIAGAAEPVKAVAEHLLNGKLWPDFTKITNASGRPVFSYQVLKKDKWQEVAGYRVMPVKVNHTVPTTGFIAGKGTEYLVYSGDTKDTDKLWEKAAKLGKKLKAVFAEVSYPDRLSEFADMTAHLTPFSLLKQLEKLGGLKPKVFAYHLKPEYEKEIAAELKKIKKFSIKAAAEGVTYKI